jgi:hypothetical protein
MVKTNQENEMRPTGGGKYGSELGSLRAEPCAITTALSFGHS